MTLNIKVRRSANALPTPANTVVCANVAWNSLYERSANASVVCSILHVISGLRQVIDRCMLCCCKSSCK